MNTPAFLHVEKKSLRRPAGALLCGCLHLLIQSPLVAAPGDLDHSFNGTGKLRFSFGPGDDKGSAAAAQADGKLIVAGSSVNGSHTDFSLLRYHADGIPDSTFGDDGNVRTRVGAGGAATAVVVQGDGKIVAAGYAAGFDSSTSGDFALVRYHPDGSLDLSFGNGGIVMTPVSPSSDYCSAMALQPDGKIILAGSTPWLSNAFDFEFNFALVRYNANGSLDASFDGDGILITQLTPGDDVCNAVIVQPDGRIVAGGSARISATDVDFALVRYLPDGTLDSSFGDDGMITTSVSTADDGATALAFQPGIASAALPDKIVAAGFSNGQETGMVVVRYRMDGSPDTSFAGDGIVHTPIGAGGEFGRSLLIEATGNQPRKIIVAGGAYEIVPGGQRFALARYLDDGSLDASFDGDGKVLTTISPFEDYCAAIAFQNGRILAAGYTYEEQQQADFAIVRYNSDGALDTSFDGDGIRTDNLGTHAASAGIVALQSDRKILTAGSTLDRGIALARCHADGSLDDSFGTGGKLTLTPFGITGFLDGGVFQPDGKFVLAASFGGVFNNYFSIARHHADGSPDVSFDGDGKLTTAVGDDTNDVNAMVLQPDGKIVVAGTSSARDVFLGTFYDVAVVRYHSDGSLDNTFDFDGIATTTVGFNAFGHAVALQTDAKIVVGGSSSANSVVSFALVRYRSNGALDPAFGNFGTVVTPMGAYNICQAVGIQADGKILAAGYSSTTATGNDFALVRYLSDGSLDTAFGGTGKVITPISNGDDRIHSLVIQDDGRVVAAGRGYGGPDSRSDFVLVRYTPDGSIDTGFGHGGIVRIDIDGDDTANGIVMDASGNFVVAGDSDGFFGVARVRGGTLPNQPPVVNILSPAQGEGYAVGGTVRIAASVSDNTTLAAPAVEFLIDGQSAGVAATFPYGIDWIATPGAHVVRARATDSFGLTTTSKGRLFFASEPVITRNADWKFLPGYSSPGTEWSTSGFDDSSWESGAAELGFGDGDEATVLPSADEPGFPSWATTFYFRRRFTIAGAMLPNYATARLLRDDGAAVYLDGQRIGVFNLPDTFDYETEALVSLPNRTVNEEAEDIIALPPELLTEGDTLLAVELHQASIFPRHQYDLSFSLSLALFSYDPGQVLTSEIIDGTLSLRWPDYLPDWVLQKSTDLVTWTSVTGAPEIFGEYFRVNVPLTGPERRKFYRLLKGGP